MYSKIKIYYFLFTKESICIDKFFLQTNIVHLEKMYVFLNMFRVDKKVTRTIFISVSLESEF